MSIILKGIDLPKEGEVKFIAIKGKTAIETYKGINVGYYSAKQIDRPHGTLIDADALKESIEEVDKPSGYTALVHIQYAPTILESEEADEHNT